LCYGALGKRQDWNPAPQFDGINFPFFHLRMESTECNVSSDAVRTKAKRGQEELLANVFAVPYYRV
jgi:hypothetical protein